MAQAELDTEDDDKPLPLLELRERVTAKTYKLLEAAEAIRNSQAEDEYEAQNLTSLFNSEEEEEEKWIRVQEWCSSTTQADGFGGYVDSEDPTALDHTDPDENPESCIKVKYILSETGGGHGDALWAASRGVANQLAGKKSCRDILAPLLQELDDSAEKKDDHYHPLQGLSFLELGAGGGLPCWTAMWCGAKVVCTDQCIPERIRCLAESAERNWRSIQNSARNNKFYESILVNAKRARACPYGWGGPTDEVTSILQDENDSDTQKLFDVIVAADCVYMPDFHTELIDSIYNLLQPRGVALLPFALHGNTEDSRVWGILEIATQKGFQVENLGSLQLKPQSYGMEAKRALVHTIRLTHNPMSGS